jgi:hypothetical protein
MLRKATIEKKSGDRFAGRILPDPDGPLAVAGYAASIDNIEIAPAGKYTLPISGTMVETCRYRDGGYTQIRTTYTRSQIHPDRTFTGTDAFIMTNISAGQPVNMLDAVQGSYIWTNGKPTAATVATTRPVDQMLRTGMSMEPRDRENPSPLIKLKADDIPYSSQLTMNEGDSISFQMPSRKVVAVWCEKQDIFGQRTASGLGTAWGEQPFKRPRPIMVPTDKPGESVAGGWDSYIRQGAVITEGGGNDDTTEFILYVDQWKVSIIEHVGAKPSLPVTIKVTPNNDK